MPIFKLNNSKLQPVKEKPCLEEKIHKISEDNLEIIFGLEIVCREFTHNNLRIDTLAFDPETKSFVIVEYKKDKNFSVIDQGYTYLGELVNNKADFILEYNEKLSKNLRRDQVDWSQSRIIFVSPKFTSYQLGAINFKDLPIELWEINLFDNDTVLFNQLKPASTSESIKNIGKNKTFASAIKEIKTYDLSDHLKNKPKEIVDLFQKFKENFLELGDNVNENVKKYFIAYRNPRLNFIGINFYQSKLRLSILIDDETLKDPKKLAKKYPESFGFAKNLKYFDFKPGDDFNYTMDLIKQSYDFNNNRWT